MNVCYNPQPCLTTDCPQGGVTRAIEDDNAGIETVWIEVVVIDEASDLTPEDPTTRVLYTE
jgi:hypothetical protein